MIKVRLQGLPEEISPMIESFKEQYDVLNVSDLYKNRGETKYVRCYVDMQLKEKNE